MFHPFYDATSSVGVILRLVYSTITPYTVWKKSCSCRLIFLQCPHHWPSFVLYFYIFIFIKIVISFINFDSFLHYFDSKIKYNTGKKLYIIEQNPRKSRMIVYCRLVCSFSLVETSFLSYTDKATTA